MLEDKYTEIERANRILFERIAKINSQNSFLGDSSQQSSSRKGRFSSVSKADSLKRDAFRLNKVKEEKRVIYNENAKLLERLQNSKSTLITQKYLQQEQVR